MRYWKRRKIPTSNEVGLAVVTYNQTNCLSSLIYALKCQTFGNFTACIMHDGPWTPEAEEACVSAIGKDKRFIKYSTDTRANKFGHNMRQAGFDICKGLGCNWIGTMNADCWYAPVYLEWMVSTALDNKANFVYCNMVHSHKLWKPLKTELKRGAIDAGGWIAHTDLVGSSKWNSDSFAADWEYVSKLKENPSFKPSKVDGYLFTHN